ncbi:hypothetical protein Athai_00930 [Actinocatenispora thailandica]|uniref:Uncharacterized protein n=1 Tax=Actinocatenispora thailandica TaxID=227318 RepID=A0A7R7DJ22_9ACTN|nr:hypothetical protein [Actinocatenispora thailandica]BCJ32590.1 hypothetical protein Athai_00930 [Actinocatenispora thailandica]
MRPAFRTTLFFVRAFVVVLELLPPVVLIVVLALLADQRLIRTPAFAGAVGLLVMAAVQLARRWNDTDGWGRTGQGIAARSREPTGPRSGTRPR